MAQKDQGGQYGVGWRCDFMAQREDDMVLVGDVTLWHKGTREGNMVLMREVTLLHKGKMIYCWWEK